MIASTEYFLGRAPPDNRAFSRYWEMNLTFRVTLLKQAKKQLSGLPLAKQNRYRRSFVLLAEHGPKYASLRTHRYFYQGKRTVWGSSASMALRFFWRYREDRLIVVLHLSSH